MRVFRPITKRSKAKPKQTQITFDSQVKTVLNDYIINQVNTSEKIVS